MLQDVSGLNRHAKQQDVLGTPKNRLVASYFELVDFLEPKFILVEQVRPVNRCVRAGL
jgi:site-specific DNA-cytosine methylase